MTTITQQEYRNLLLKFANADVRYCKKNGSHIVTGTKQGNVQIVFEQGRYSIKGFNVTITHRLLVTAVEVKNWLIENYVVTLEDTVVV